VKRLLVIAIAVGVVYWIVRDQPSVKGLIDGITRPLLGSKAAVEEAEHNRIVDEAAPAITEDDEKKVAALREGMRASEVRQLFGDPNVVEDVVVDGRKQVAWTYRRIHRVLYFEENRVVSIAIR
jgi:hypothetical protein